MFDTYYVGVNSIITIHEEKERLQVTNKKGLDEEKEVVTNTRKKDTRCAKIFRKRISKLKKIAGLLVSCKIKNPLGAQKKCKPAANQSLVPFNSVTNDYTKKINFGIRNCQYCSDSDSSDCDEDDDDDEDDEDEHAHCNVPRRAPKGTMYRPRPPLGLVHQARPRPSIYPNNWARQLPPRAWGLPPQPPLLPPAPPHVYGYQNPYGYNLMPPPHAYGYQNPYNYNIINGIMPVPRPVYPHYYDQKPMDHPVGNSFIHFLSDDNTASSCTIM